MTSAQYRSWLCTSPFRERFHTRAVETGADLVHYDLEDSIPAAKKVLARELLAAVPWNESVRPTAMRVNAIGSRDGIEDLRSVAAGHLIPDILILPKVHSAGEVAVVASLLEECGHKTQVYVVIETLDALVDLDHICRAHRRVRGLIFGAADMSAALGVPVDNRSRGMFHTKFQIAAAAARRGLTCIDSPCFSLNDDRAMTEELATGVELGFAGKIAIHPSQVERINAAYAPTAAQMEHARDMLAALDGTQSTIAAFDGQMVGPPFAKIARGVISRGARTNTQQEGA